MPEPGTEVSKYWVLCCSQWMGPSVRVFVCLYVLNVNAYVYVYVYV